MEGISNASRQRCVKPVNLIVNGALAIVLLMHTCAYSQECNSGASEWLGELALIEAADLPTDLKIKKLSALNERYEKCHSSTDSVYARMIHRLGDFYRIAGDYETGISLTQRALSINKHDHPGAQKTYLTHSYYNLGLYNNLLGLTDNAQLYYDSCIENALLFPEKTFIGLMALEKKSYMYFQTGDYEQSIRTAERGINLAQKGKLSDYEALLLIQKAQSESEIKRVDQAERNIRKAIAILNDHHLDAYLPNAYSVYANVLSKKKKFTEAIWHYNQASRLNSMQQNPEQSARDLHDLAFLYDKELNDAEKSVFHYLKAINLLKSLKDPYILSATYNNLGLVYWRQNDFQKALEYYQQGLLALPIGFKDEDPKTNPPIGKLTAATNEYILAALLWNKGDSWLGLYNLRQDPIYLKYALASYHDGDRMVDEMRWSQQGEQSKLFWREKTKLWYKRAIEASSLLNDPEEAFYFMEKSRAVLLNDKLAELGANNKLPVHEAETERTLRIRLSSIAGRSGNAEGFTSSEEQRKARYALRSFIKQLEEKYPSYYAYKYDTAVFSLSNLQTSLIPGEQAWVELFTNNNTIFALTVTSDDAKLNKIHFEDHEAIAKRITELCSDKSSINKNFREYQTLSYLYYKNVFKPLNISSMRVTISQDEYFLPFDLLRYDSSVATSFLLKQHAFSYAYSASHVLRNKTKDALPENSLLAMAPVDYASNLKLQTLNGADQSLERIGSLFTDGVYLTNRFATKKQFLEQLPAFNMIHLYSHATADSLGNEPAIYFYDSALNLSELGNLPDLNTRLIVLFACNTGVGKTIKGEGIFSLARGFASAGIPSTISALWQIDNNASYDLAEQFYKNLADGQPSDAALQQAKLEMITSERDYELPYFWAGAVLIGRAESYEPRNADSFLNGYKYILFGMFVSIFLALILIANKRRLSKKLFVDNRN